jgi:hypothetical protein
MTDKLKYSDETPREEQAPVQHPTHRVKRASSNKDKSPAKSGRTGCNQCEEQSRRLDE